jgi:starch synthase
MVAAEASTFAHTGGLADVMYGLPKALAEVGDEIAVVLPYYRETEGQPPTVYERLRVAVGSATYLANILEEKAHGVRYLFVQIPELYDRKGLYGDASGDFPDNHVRFAALCHAALGIARHVFSPQILHGHDWHAALVPLLLREIYPLHPAYLGLKTVFTIHNLGYQGIFSREALADLGIPERLFRPGLLEFWGRVNLLQGAIATSDAVTTVSPHYAQEIQTPEFGFGLDTVLRARSRDLKGILNGADCEEWNPATDVRLPSRFHAGDLSGKRVCKRELLRELGLEAEREGRPLAAIVSRFTPQKGLDLLTKIPHECVAENISLVVTGSGDRALEDFFHWFSSAYPKKVVFRPGYEEAFTHRLMAGSDMLLIPSRYEPCGLSQMYAMRYGTLPVARRIGGLADTVDEKVGFVFERDDPYEFLESIRGAVRVWSAALWQEKMQAAMSRDFSWKGPAAEYRGLYNKLLEGNRA